MKDRNEVLTRNLWASNTNIAELWPKSEKYKKNQVFFIGPFYEPYNTLYFKLIKPTIEHYGLKCLRDDENKLSEQFLPRILEKIKTSRFVIADISLDRPNVLFELGWVTAMGTPSLIITSSQRPSDLSLLTIPRYQFTVDGLKNLAKLITDSLIQEELVQVKNGFPKVDYLDILNAAKLAEAKKSKITVHWMIKQEDVSGPMSIINKFLEDPTYDIFSESKSVNAVKIQKNTLKTKLDLGFETKKIPTEEDIENRTRFYEDFITEANKRRIKFEDYQNLCKSFNEELEKKQNEIESYIRYSSIIKNSPNLNIFITNGNPHFIEDVQIILEFPPEVFVYNRRKPPNRPIPKKIDDIRKSPNYFNKLAKSMIFGNIDDEFEEEYGKGIDVKSEHYAEGFLYSIVNRKTAFFLNDIVIGGFESGRYKVFWELTYEGLSNPVSGELEIIVD